jgi:hypothetical protein
MAWKADSLQGVLFTVPGLPQLDAQQVWSLVADGLPETVQRPAATPNGLSIAQGPFRDHHLTVHSQLGRIDFILHALPPQTPSDIPPQIADYEGAAGLIGEMLIRSVPRARPIRLAMVGEFGKAFPLERDVSNYLSEQTGGIWFPLPATDAIYQVNARKYYAGSAEIAMNRIVTWSGSTYQTFMATFNTGPGMPAGFATPKQVYAASLKIDVNSHTSDDISAFAEEIVRVNHAEMSAITKQGLAYLR